MLSKSKGQVLRIAAVMHVLFHIENPNAIPSELSEAAVKAADCFVDLCLQHAAFLGGRGDLKTEVIIKALYGRAYYELFVHSQCLPQLDTWEKLHNLTLLQHIVSYFLERCCTSVHC